MSSGTISFDTFPSFKMSGGANVPSVMAQSQSMLGTQEQICNHWLEVVLVNESITDRAFQLYDEVWPQWRHTIINNKMHAQECLERVNLWEIYTCKINMPYKTNIPGWRKFTSSADLIDAVLTKPCSVYDFLSQCEQVIHYEILMYDQKRSTIQ